MTDHSEAQVSEDSGAQRLIASGTEIAGGVSASLVSAATGLILGGPEGAALGGTVGASLSIGLRWLGGELSSRLLSPREEQRLGYVYTLAAAEIAERLTKGERLREDGFFGESHQARSDAEEVWESALLKSQREPEEKKLPYMARLLASLAFAEEVGVHMAHQITKNAEHLTYRQLCIMKLTEEKDRYDLRQGDYRDEGGKFPITLYQLFYEYYDLHNRGYINSGAGTMLGLTDLNPSMVTLQGMGTMTFRLMLLGEIPEEDIVPIATQLA